MLDEGERQGESNRSMKRVLLLLPTTGYRNRDFLDAAGKLRVQIVAAADCCHQLAPGWRRIAASASRTAADRLICRLEIYAVSSAALRSK